jgi:hypothetical protein
MQSMWSTHVGHTLDCDHLVNVGLSVVVRSPLIKWQDLTPTSDGGDFYDFCDALEVLDGTFVPGADGWGLGHALTAWAKYSRESVPTSEWVQ